MNKAPSPQDQFNRYLELLAGMSDQKILDCFNNQVGCNAWTSSRASYLAALHQTFEDRSWDYSEIGSSTTLSFRYHVYLKGKKLSVFSGN